MKTAFFPCSALLLTATLAFGADAVAPESAAEKAYAEFRAVRYAQVPRQADVAAASKLQMKQHDESSRLAEKFYKRFPDDPRKWEILGVAVNSPRQYFGPGVAAEQAAWEKRRNELRKMILADSSVPANIWTTVAEWTVGDMAGSRGRPVADLKWAGEVVEQMAVRVPASERRRFVEQTYFDALEKHDPATAEKLLRSRLEAGEANPSVRDVAAGRLRIIEAARAPLDLRFVAADGREVDLAKLRGKVVLVDFWATWCVPCIEEMPNVRAAYRKYHELGFEVIGIAFENSRLLKADTPETIAQKKKAAKEKLIKFAGENGMDWPHHFDGEYWSNEFGRRFAIASIPATFLLGRDGRLVTTEVRGEKLGAEIERLLKL
jgi:thiol-disulfide isomerase/thioredoxin